MNCHRKFCIKKKQQLLRYPKLFLGFKILFNPSSPIFDPNLLSKNLKKLSKHNFITTLALSKPQI